MARRLVTALVAVTTIGILAGCGAATGSNSPGSGGVAESPSAAPSASAGELTLSGQVEQGVEPGCLILHAGGKNYELMTDDHTVVHVGAQVVVTGHIATGMMSHCQQGQIFQVTSARQG